MNNEKDNSRRKFLQALTKKIGKAAQTMPSVSIITKAVSTPTKQTETKKLGIALVGLGKYSTDQLAPALQKTKYCKLAGIVTGSPDKAIKWGEKYKIPQENIYNYENFDEIAKNPAIHIVYIVLPNAMHAEFTIRAAKAGKHVICEKPMAVSMEECFQMINACEEAGRMLSIGYRLHFQPHHREVMRLGQQNIYGYVKKINTQFGSIVNDPEEWRLKKKLSGGGALMDVGIYPIQAARYTLGMEPIGVTAHIEKNQGAPYKEVEGDISWTLEFPYDINVESSASYTNTIDRLHVEAENGWFELSPAFQYVGQKLVTHQGEVPMPESLPQVSQMDDFVLCILNHTPSEVSGEEGLKDIKIIEAIYESARTGERVNIHF